MSSKQDFRITDNSNMCTSVTNSVKEGDKKQSMFLENTTGSLSSMSMLLNLLETASLKNSNSKSVCEAPVTNTTNRSREHGFMSTTQRSKSDRNMFEMDGLKSDLFRTKTNRPNARWKTPSSVLVTPMEMGKGTVLSKDSGVDVLPRKHATCDSHTMGSNRYEETCSNQMDSLYPTMNSPQKINTVSPQQSKKPDVFFCRDNKPIDAGTVKETSEATKKELPTSINKQSTQDASSGVLRSSSKVVWRPRLSVDPKTSLSRQVKGLLNKLTVDNFPVVADQVATIFANITDWDLLKELLDLLLDKAFNEPDFSQLYADLCLIISYSNSLFSVPANNSSSKKTSQQTAFSSVIIQKWGDAFNQLSEKFERAAKFERSTQLEGSMQLEQPPDDKNIPANFDDEYDLSKLKRRMKGICVSFGEFLIRKIIPIRGFNVASCVLLGEKQPQDHFVEGLCQILTTAGAYLDTDPVGKLLIENVFGRLQELQLNKFLSKRISCLVQDLFDARKVQWHRRVHKEQAKTLTQIKEDAENADLVGGSTVRVQYGFVVQLGERSNLLGNAHYANYMKLKEEEHRRKMSVKN